jgi:hypothetical protein
MKSHFRLCGHVKFQFIHIIFLHFIILISLPLFSFTQYDLAAQVHAEDNLSESDINRFPVTAIDKTGNESGYPSDIIKTIPTVPDYSLTLNKTGSGTGTITGTEINCGTTCSGSYPGGTVIELTADPDTGSSFAGWSGGRCEGTATCRVVLDAATTVTARFDKVYTIRTIADNNGTITTDGPGSLNQASDHTVTIGVLAVTPENSLTIRIIPNPGYHLADLRVDGISVGIAGTYTFVKVTSDHTITASFTPDY